MVDEELLGLVVLDLVVKVLWKLRRNQDDNGGSLVVLQNHFHPLWLDETLAVVNNQRTQTVSGCATTLQHDKRTKKQPESEHGSGHMRKA